MADRASIQKTIDSYMAAFTASDKEGWLSCFAEGAWIEDPVGTARRDGLGALAAFWDETHAVPDTIELRPLGITTIIGDEAAFTMQARPSLGGETYAIDIIDVMTFDGEARITTMRAFFDPETMRPVAD
ncbi:MAG TPA: nuclear transport factor 2 family protein [Acidimicrobiales bacterium]